MKNSPCKSSPKAIEQPPGLCQDAPEIRTGKTVEKPSIQSSRTKKREKSFKLSLSALVNGTDASGNRFQERTKISSISSQEAIFRLNSGVTIGSKLSILIEIPKTLILENQLKLLLSGEVIYVKAETNKNKSQLISLRLDRSYRINSAYKKNKNLS